MSVDGVRVRSRDSAPGRLRQRGAMLLAVLAPVLLLGSGLALTGFDTGTPSHRREADTLSARASRTETGAAGHEHEPLSLILSPSYAHLPLTQADLPVPPMRSMRLSWRPDSLQQALLFERVSTLEARRRPPCV